MPELPEVETTRRGILPHVQGRRVTRVVVRDARLRWPVDDSLARELPGNRIVTVDRRGKYLLLRTDRGTLVIHLGMSGSLRVVTREDAPRKHDHLDLVVEGGAIVRFHDPRRFGCALWTRGDPTLLPLLAHLGLEPFDRAFDADYLASQSRRRPGPVKSLLMDASVVVGVGNIYANEALFGAGIHPHRAANRIALDRYAALAKTVRTVLRRAIRAGGTTLRDFVNSAGEPGYFSARLAVYDREGEPCRSCREPIRLSRRIQRATYFCPQCQR